MNIYTPNIGATKYIRQILNRHKAQLLTATQEMLSVRELKCE